MTNGGRARGSAVLAVIVLAFSGLLAAGCSPRWVAVTAVYDDGGHPTVIFDPCRGTRIAEIVLMQRDPSTASASTSGLFWNVIDVDHQHPLDRARLMETPPGWAVQPGLPGSQITELRDDRTYSVWANNTIDHVDFTLAQLRALPPGQVWAPPKAFAPERAMTAEEFRKDAAASC